MGTVKGTCLLLLLVAYRSVTALQDMDAVKQKFEYKHSFKGPSLVNTMGEIPFWKYFGNTIPSWDQVRVCPSIHSRQGAVWNNVKFTHKDWMVDIKLRITGRLKTGADGMAIWFTADQSVELGPSLGGPEKWRGLGVFLDSFDNDGKQDNPKIQVVFNDGSVNYGHHNDGIDQEQFSCLKDFRNRPHAVRLRIIRIRNTLEVWVHEGLSQRDADYDLCGMVVNTANIPDEGYFGITAATGGLSDDHDVTSFIVHSLTALDEVKTPEEYSEEKAKEYQQKFEQFAEELGKKRGAPSQHTDHPNVYQDSYEQELTYEAGWETNVRQILEAQATMNRILQTLQGKTDIIMSNVLSAPVTPPPSDGANVGQQQQQQLPYVGGVTADLSAIKNTQSLVQHQLSDLRTYLEQNRPAAAAGGGGGIASEALQPIYELKHTMEQSLKTSNEVLTKLSAVTGMITCPPPPPCQSCVTVFHLIILISAQLIVLFVYNWFRQRQETAAKKFF